MDSLFSEAANHETLVSLKRSLQFAQKFSLILVECDRLIENFLIRHLQEELDRPIKEIMLSRPMPNLLEHIQQAAQGYDALIVTGLETTFYHPEMRAKLLTHLNTMRNHYVTNLKGPLVLIMRTQHLIDLSRAAPDFFAIRSGWFAFKDYVFGPGGTLFPRALEMLYELEPRTSDLQLDLTDLAQRLGNFLRFTHPSIGEARVHIRDVSLLPQWLQARVIIALLSLDYLPTFALQAAEELKIRYVRRKQFNRKHFIKALDIAETEAKTKETLDLLDLEPSLTNRMMALSKCVRSLKEQELDLEIIERALLDKHFSHHHHIQDWIKLTEFDAPHALADALATMRKKLNQIAKPLFAKMTTLSGLEFPNDLKAFSLNFKWFILGEAPYLHDLSSKNYLIDVQPLYWLRPRTWMQARAEFDASFWEGELRASHASDDLPSACRAFFQLEHQIKQSLAHNGILLGSLDWNERGISDTEATLAQHWIHQNTERLLGLAVRTYRFIKQRHEQEPKAILPPIIAGTLNQASPPDRTIPFDEIERKIALNDGIEAKSLAELCSERIQISDLQNNLMNIDRIDRLARDKQTRFHLKELIALCYRLEDKKKNLDKQILSWVQRDATVPIEKAHWDLVRHIARQDLFRRLRCLDFNVLKVDTFAAGMKQIQKCAGASQEAFFMRFIQQMNMIPRDTLLLEALNHTALPEQTQSRLALLVIKAENERQELLDAMLNQLRDQLTDSSNPSLHFEVFGLSRMDATRLRQSFQQFDFMLNRVSDLRDADAVYHWLDGLENRIIEAMETTRYTQQKMASLDKSILNFSSEQLLQQNHKELQLLLKDINLAFIRLKNHLNPDTSTSEHFTSPLNDRELASLKAEYPFLGSCSLEDYKRFAFAFSRRDQILRDVLKRAHHADSKLPEALLQVVTPPVYERYISSAILPFDVKLTILDCVGEVLEAEVGFLATGLNFLRKEDIQSQTLYKNFLWFIRDGEPNISKRLWASTKTRLNKYQPPTHQENFKENLQRLSRDVEAIL